ncbi:hypothetical protein J31TS6_22560 [Brevibacillus reuszeri]|uniref:hypothetical protein n=1 Tax=Brevibacillus reuszeri TaxID=54915 RepID=UPI001B28160B|nr:hypothetical protein [Brevibacillus reuszeri]GIO06228.1 hypothetical protein J31TS6_22560 [Brevibacillus reuszeri]
MELKDIPSFIQAAVLVIAGLIALCHYSIKFHRKHSKLDKMFDSTRLIPPLVILFLLSITSLSLALLFQGLPDNPSSYTVIAINVGALILGRLEISYLKKKFEGRIKQMLFILIFISLLYYDIKFAIEHFKVMNAFVLVYIVFTLLFYLFAGISNLYALLFGDLKNARMKFVLKDEEFLADLLLETSKGDYIVKKVDEPDKEYWINRDEVRKISIDVSREGR